MSNRRPPQDSITARPTTGAPRSPGEKATPGRPAARAVKRRAPPREPRQLSPFFRFLNAVFTLALVICVVGAGAAFFLRATIDDAGPLAEARTIVIPRGEGSHEIAARLERDGVIGDRRLFVAGYWWQSVAARWTGAKPVSLKAGEYEIKENASIRGIIDTLNDGRTVLVRFTVPEGLTSYQIVERLKAEQALTGDIAAVPAEGTLLPETYSVQRGATRQSVLDQMAEAQIKMLEKLWAGRQDGLPFTSPMEAVTLASIIERETGRGDERERVAGLFVNRLRSRMKLQSDPTILYGIYLGKVQWGKTIYLSEKKAKNAHNTYEIVGLPPTPICNPGRATLTATLNPAKTKDLFFVADGRGAHVFAETNAEHNANVAKWRVIERSRAAAAASKGETVSGLPPGATAPSTEDEAVPAAAAAVAPAGTKAVKTRAAVTKAPGTVTKQ